MASFPGKNVTGGSVLLLVPKEGTVFQNLGELHARSLLFRYLKIVKSFFNKIVSLKVQSCKLYNNKYMIASTQITNTDFLTITHS